MTFYQSIVKTMFSFMENLLTIWTTFLTVRILRSLMSRDFDGSLLGGRKARVRIHQLQASNG